MLMRDSRRGLLVGWVWLELFKLRFRGQVPASLLFSPTAQLHHHITTCDNLFPFCPIHLVTLKFLLSASPVNRYLLP